MRNTARIAIAEWLINRAANLMALAANLCIDAERRDYAQNILNVLDYGVKHERMDERWHA